MMRRKGRRSRVEIDYANFPACFYAPKYQLSLITPAAEVYSYKKNGGGGGKRQINIAFIIVQWVECDSSHLPRYRNSPFIQFIIKRLSVRQE